jgi:FAD/FMN-containing dehydrogenase
MASLVAVKYPADMALAAFKAAVGPGGFIADAADMLPYVEDWRGRYAGVTPLVLRPETTEQVAAIVRIAAAHRVALVPQGGNTGLVGGGVPDMSGGMVMVNLQRMNRIRTMAADDFTVVTEAGVILSDLHAAADGVDREFPLSLAAKGSARIGGLISTNAGGVQVLRYGCMRSLVLGLEAVLPSGDIFHGLTPLRKDNTGYDLKQLLIGAEGTLGIITAATLKLYPKPRQTATAFVALRDPEDAVTLLRQLRQATGDMVSSFELIPKTGIEIVLQFIPGTRDPFPGGMATPWAVLVEATSAAEGDVLASQLEAGLMAALEAGLIDDVVLAQNQTQAAMLWKIRESLPDAEKIEGGSLKHDVSVAVAAMPAFMAEATADLEALLPGSRVLAFGHLGDGNVHFNLRPTVGADATAFYADHHDTVAARVHDIVVERYGGSISAEHGIGTLKRDEHARLADPAKLAAQRAIKAALDPQNIMNPGRVL